MASLTKPELGIIKGYEISPAMRGVLGHVFVNMPWNYIDRYVDLIIENGMNVEIGFGAEDLEKASICAVSSVVGRMRERGCRITFHGPFWDLCSGSIDHRIREIFNFRYNSLLDLAEAVRPEQIVCHSGFDPRHHRGHRSIWIDNSVSTWAALVRRAETQETPLVLENVWEEDPSLHLQVLEKVKSPWLGICLDAGHQHSFSKTTLDKWLEAIWPHLKEVHIHDNDGANDSHLPVGSGTIDFDYLFNFLRKKRISPTLTLEPHTAQHMKETLTGLAEMVTFNDYVNNKGGGPS